MILLDRFTLKLFLKILYVSILVIVSIFLFSQMLDRTVRMDVPATVILKYYLLQSPTAIIKFFPFASLIASLLCLSLLNRKSELTAMLSVGYSLSRISTVWGIAMLINCFLLFVIADRIVPIANRARQVIKTQEIDKKVNFYTEIKDDRIWYKSDDYIFSVVRYLKEENKLIELEIFQLDKDFNFKKFLQSTFATFEPNGWVLHQVSQTVFENKNSFPIRSHLETFYFPIKEKPEDFSDVNLHIDNLNFAQTLTFIHRNERLGLPTFAQWTNFHYRIASLFSPLIFLLLGIPFGLTHKRRANFATNMSKCLMITLLYLGVEQVLILMGNVGKLNPILAAWSNNLIFLLVAIILVARKKAW